MIHATGAERPAGESLSIKKAVRNYGRHLLVPFGALGGRRKPGVHFLLYHKVSGELPLELEIPFPVFRRQMRFLAGTGRVVSYSEALRRLAARDLSRDLFVLTFDDGYLDFYTHAFPTLKELGLPSTLFFSTHFVDSGTPCVLSSPAAREVRPLTWEMLAEVHASGLVTLGAHTHRHPELPGCTDDEILRELLVPKEVCRERLGIELTHFAYPRGAWNSRVERFVRRHYDSAALVGWGKVTSGDLNMFRIERVPVQRRDNWFCFRAKTRGWLKNEKWLYEVLR